MSRSLLVRPREPVPMPAPRVVPRSTRAVVMTGFRPVEDPACFVEREMPLPALQPRDLLVRVRAVSVNPVDAKVRKRTPVEGQQARILGWDAAGTVVATGAQAVHFRPGDRVFYAGDIERPGNNAEYHVVDERIVGVMPATLNFEQAAALPLTALTAWEMLFERLEVRRLTAGNGHLLVIAGAGGLGSMAIQMARHAGLRVIATASRPESAAWVRAQGAHAVVNHARGLVAEWKRLGLPAPEYIFCCAETDDYFDAMAELVAPQGRIGVVASSRRAHDIQPLMGKSTTLVYENVFAKSGYQTRDMESQRRILNQVAGLVEHGELRGTLTEVLGPLNAESLRAAHARIESGRTIGKLVLQLPD